VARLPKNLSSRSITQTILLLAGFRVVEIQLDRRVTKGIRRMVNLNDRAPKRKWFQVTRFPACSATGMHGSESCVSERRASSGWLPEWLFFSPSGSVLSGVPQPSLFL
jgi:hypothetical protein